MSETVWPNRSIIMAGRRIWKSGYFFPGLSYKATLEKENFEKGEMAGLLHRGDLGSLEEQNQV